MNRIITRILLVFWAAWFGLKALAAFGGGNGSVSAGDLAAGLPFTMNGLWVGLAMTMIAGLFLWAFMAATVGEGAEDDDVTIIIKIAFSAAAAWLGSYCLMQASDAGNPLISDGISPMILLLVSFVVASREAVWAPVEAAEDRRSHAIVEAMAAGASYEAELVHLSGRKDMRGKRT